MWLVIFKTESGDTYEVMFNKKPTEGELKTYMVKNYEYEFQDNQAYIYVSDVLEMHAQSVPDDDPESYKDIEWL